MLAIGTASPAASARDAGPDRPTEGPSDRVTIELSGRGTPYQRVRYEIEPRRGALVASVRKELAQGFGHWERLGLLATDEYRDFFRGLERLDVHTLRSRRQDHPEVRYRVSLRLGDRAHRFTVDDPMRLADRRYGRLIDLVRALVRQRAGAVPFRDAMLLDEEAGALRLTSTPRARVTLDGVRLPTPTPIMKKRLPAGRHELELVSLDGKQRQAFEITVEVGKITQMSLELK